MFEELNVPEEGSKRAMETIEIFRKYQETLVAQNLIDENDVMTECPAIIKGIITALPSSFLTDFTKSHPQKSLS